MADISYLINQIEKLNTSPLRVFSDEALEFADDLSKTILKDKSLRNLSDAVTFAFWCRKSSISQMMAQYEDKYSRIGRGVCFHVAPGNIPINFMFTYMFGVLSGCSNIVRLPSRDFEIVNPLLNVLKEVLSKHSEIDCRTVFVRYPSTSEATSTFCSMADARVIWGGDDTIQLIKQNAVKPRCVDLCFADRYSICLIDGRSIEIASDTELIKLVENFYNDTYLMDQNACSSPQMIFWLNANSESKQKFWNAVFEVANKKYVLQSASAIDKYTQACMDAIDSNATVSIAHKSNIVYVEDVKCPARDITSLRGKCGFFYETDVCDITEIEKFVTEKYQTLTYYGVEPKVLQKMVIDKNLKGIDRIVPVGKAMNIGIVWDGFDVVRVLSRIVSLV